MTTSQEQFDTYTTLGDTVLKPLITGQVQPGPEADRLLATPVTLPNGTTKTVHNLTAEDFEAMRDYMNEHAARLRTLARMSRLECQVLRPDLVDEIDWPEDQL